MITMRKQPDGFGNGDLRPCLPTLRSLLSLYCMWHLSCLWQVLGMRLLQGLGSKVFYCKWWIYPVDQEGKQKALQYSLWQDRFNHSLWLSTPLSWAPPNHHGSVRSIIVTQSAVLAARTCKPIGMSKILHREFPSGMEKTCMWKPKATQ